MTDMALVDDRSIADEIRVVQSVQTQRSLPTMLFGNALAVAIVIYVDWTAAIASHAVYLLGAELLLLLPMLRSYLRLRGLARPEHVSKRRIQLIEIHSLLMGLVWSVAVVLLMPHLGQVDGVFVMLIMFFLGYGAVALTPSIPLASAAYFGPLFLTTFIVAYVNDILGAGLLILASLSGMLAMSRTVWQSWQDVTATVRMSLERLQAETELHQRETQAMRAMLEAIPFPLVLTRESGALEASEQAARQFGIPSGEVAGLNIADFFVDPSERERMAELQRTQGRLDEYEVQFKDAQGSPFWALLSSLPMRYEGGDCWLNSIYVIDDRKQAEEALRESERQLQRILETSPIAVGIAAKEGRIRFANSRFRAMFRIREVDLDSASPADSFTDPDLRRELYYHLSQGASVHDLEVELPRADQTSIWALLTSNPIIYELEDSSLFWFYDITERKRAEEELEQSRELLQSLADNIPEFISFKDLDGRFQFVNKCFEDWTQQDRRDVVGKTVHDIYPAEQAATFAAQDRECLESREMITREILLDYPDGNARTVVSTRYPVVSSTGDVLGLGTVNYDLSERKAMEDALRESEGQLRHILEISPIAVGIVAMDGNFLFANSRFLEMLKLDKSKLESFRPQDGFADDEIRRDIFRRMLEGETLEFIEVELVRDDGEKIWTILSPNQITYEGQSTVLFWLHDITERKRAEAELLQAKQRAEEANETVLSQNQMLETVSAQLSKYISPQLYEAIFSGTQKVEIASQRRKLTVFFSDIAGFTETTDELESEELTALLNQYLTEMSKIALSHGATIDKFIGDAMLLYFGDPQTKGVKEDATACVEMAIAMQRRMGELQAEWREEGLEQPFELRIGINTGYCTVGNFGSAERMDYTIIGSAVNLASRLQSYADVGGILLANETHSLVKDWVLAAEGEAITVKGFTKPVRTFRVEGLYDDLAREGRILRREQDGLSLTIDRSKLAKGDNAEAIAALEGIISELKE